MSTYFWPFAQNPAGGIPQTITYDLIIDENYPGIGLQSTLPAGGYAEIRLVSGCLWFVTNATFNPQTLQWEQDSPPCNPALNAYAFVQCQDGTLTRYIAQATNTISGAVDWVAVLQDDANGNLVISPLLLTAENQVAEKVDPTWNAGSSASMVAREVNVTDTSSATDSYLDQLSVGGEVKWQVRKDGTLTVGIVPASLVPGVIDQLDAANPAIISVTQSGHIATIGAAHGDYVDLPNAQTITGTKTLADAVSLMLGAVNGACGALVASSVFGGTCLSYGARYTGSAFTWQAEAASAFILRIDPVNGLTLYYNTSLTIGNTYAPTEVFNVNDAGQITTTSPIEPSVLASEFEGTDGITVSFDSGTDKVNVSGVGLIASITSSALSITQTGQTVDIEPTGAGIGATVAAGQAYDQANVNPFSLTQEIALGEGTWFLEGEAWGFDWTGSGDPGTVTLTGQAASGVTWYNTSIAVQATEFSRSLYTAGVAVIPSGGGTVSITLSGYYTRNPLGGGVITLKASRTG